MNAINTSAVSAEPTVIAPTEVVKFRDAVQALPGVESLADSLDEVDMVSAPGAVVVADDDVDSIDVKEILRLTPESDEIMVVMERFIVAGGLCYDSDAEDPMDDDGMGTISHYGRRGDSTQNSTFYAALGLTSSGDKDLETSEIEEQMVALIRREMPKHRAMMASLSSTLRDQGHSGKWDSIIEKLVGFVTRCGWANAVDRFVSEYLRASWFERLDSDKQDKLSPLQDMLCESNADKCWELAVDRGSLGNPLAVKLDIYEHSGRSYSISGEGMQCRWDTSSCGAIWEPDSESTMSILETAIAPLRDIHFVMAEWVKDPGAWIDRMAAAFTASGTEKTGATLLNELKTISTAQCRGMLESYNSWVNGDVYGVVVYAIDRTTGELIDELDSECWGHIGHSYAVETLEDEILSMVENLSAKKH